MCINKIYCTIVFLLVLPNPMRDLYAQNVDLIQNETLGTSLHAYTEKVYHAGSTKNTTLIKNNIIGYSEGKYYIFPTDLSKIQTDASDLVKFSCEIGVLDEKLNLIKSRNIFDFNYYGKVVEFEMLLLWKDQLLLFTTELLTYSSTALYYQVIDKETLLPGMKQLVHSDTANSNQSGFKFSISPDKSKLGILLFGDNTRTIVFEQQMTNLFSDVVYEIALRPVDFGVDNYGNTYITSINKQSKINQIKSDYYSLPLENDLTTYTLSVFFNSTKGFNQKKIEFLDTQINICSLNLTDYLTGWILTGIYGITTIEVDPVLENFIIKRNLFPPTLYSNIISETSDFTSDALYIVRNCIPQKEGGYIITGEMISKTYSPSHHVKSRSGGGYDTESTWYYIYGDIVLIKYSKDNSVVWIKAINRHKRAEKTTAIDQDYPGNNKLFQPLLYEESKTDKTRLKYFSFFYMSSMNDSFILFSDQSGVQRTLNICKISGDNILQQKIPYNNKIRSCHLVPYLSQYLTDHSALLFMRGHNINHSAYKYRLMKLELK
jgi:hypothetical protein